MPPRSVALLHPESHQRQVGTLRMWVGRLEEAQRSAFQVDMVPEHISLPEVSFDNHRGARASKFYDKRAA